MVPLHLLRARATLARPPNNAEQARLQSDRACRTPRSALADTALVLEVDPANAKALARKRVCEQAVMAEG